MIIVILCICLCLSAMIGWSSVSDENTADQYTAVLSKYAATRNLPSYHYVVIESNYTKVVNKGFDMFCFPELELDVTCNDKRGNSISLPEDVMKLSRIQVRNDTLHISLRLPEQAFKEWNEDNVKSNNVFHVKTPIWTLSCAGSNLSIDNAARNDIVFRNTTADSLSIKSKRNVFIHGSNVTSCFIDNNTSVNLETSTIKRLHGDETIFNNLTIDNKSQAMECYISGKDGNLSLYTNHPCTIHWLGETKK